MKVYDAIVVGAGPAGIMAAAGAALRGEKVLLLEKTDSPGKKLLISGKGRCNITNASKDIEEFISHFSPSGKFLRNAFCRFFNNDLIDFFQKRGIHLKTERGKRVFPATDRSKDVLRALMGYIKDSGAEFLVNKEVIDIKKENDIFRVTAKDKSCYCSKKVVLATGGISYPKTGSTGFGFYIARRLSHTVIRPKPGLVGICINSELPKLWRAITLKNVRCSVIADNKTLADRFGEMIFTHFGASGPIILDLSAIIYDSLQDYKEVEISIDFKPALTYEKLQQRLLREFNASGARMIATIFKNILPSRLIPEFLKSAGIDNRKKANQISKKERLNLINSLKDFRFNVAQTRPISEAVVTRGGVATKEINPKTMESYLIKGLYIVGELLDVDAETGGYNMQAAFSTGYVCAENL